MNSCNGHAAGENTNLVCQQVFINTEGTFTEWTSLVQKSFPTVRLGVHDYY